MIRIISGKKLFKFLAKKQRFNLKYYSTKMKSLDLYTSNHLEILVEKLAEILRTPLPSLFDQEIIVVQSRGMERWVSMKLAERLGICTNIRFPFPNAFVYEMIQKVIPEIPDPSPFDPEFMIWKIMDMLPSCIEKQGFESIRNYLEGTERNLKCYQLSERLSNTFDQYLLYRPEMMFRWEKGEDDHWQAVLWRELIKDLGNQHRAALGKTFFEALEKNRGQIEGFPQRISVFGISALPRFHIQIIDAISQFTPVYLFLMNPCREYWGDIVSDREIKRVIGLEDSQTRSAEELYLERGNSLLASMGTLGRNFFDLINEISPQDFSNFEEPDESSLLATIQSDILNLFDREKAGQKQVIVATDLSIQIHSCHSPMREVEVLHDQLLKMFKQNPDLLPKDILVMTPDIEIYGPYIQAVFDLPADDSRRIPFSITDRSVRRENQIVETFLAILDSYESRFGAAQVVSILESPAVRSKFDLSEADLELIRIWISDTRIRWGIDKNYRRAMGLPATSENTWKAGLDRLLLGYALPGHGENMFAGILPFDNIEGNETSILGNFLEFIEKLFSSIESMGQTRTLEGWSVFLRGILDHFFEPESRTENELLVIWRTLNHLSDIQGESKFSEKIDIQIIKNYLERLFEKEILGYGFMTGGVTFCAMLPMRSIPFKVICLIGMNDDAYPRQDKSLGFNLMVKHPKPGDRSHRKDDRYLFLETLLSAREKLYISYVGQSIQDNSLIPPSVLVSELVDYIEAGFEIPGRKILDHLITKHRLQAFSPEYFKGNEKLFSYSNDNYEAAKCLIDKRHDALQFISKGLTDPGNEWKKIDLNSLCSFFLNPAKYILTKRLGIQLEEGITILSEDESFEIENLDRYLLEQNLVEKRFDEQDLKDFQNATKASGMLPHGTVGECIYDRFSREVESFVRQTQPFIQVKPLGPVEVDFKISGFNLTGQIDRVYPNQLFRFRYAKIKSKDRLRIWIYHLVLNYLNLANCPQNSILVGLNPDSKDNQWAGWEFSSLENAKELLDELLAIYWEGLIKPIHFFPESSWEYAYQILERNKSSEHALEKARDVWTGSDYSRGESEDLYYRLCFANTDPIDLLFQEIAIEIFKPILENQVKIN